MPMDVVEAVPAFDHLDALSFGNRRDREARSIATRDLEGRWM